MFIIYDFYDKKVKLIKILCIYIKRKRVSFIKMMFFKGIRNKQKGWALGDTGWARPVWGQNNFRVRDVIQLRRETQGQRRRCSLRFIVFVSSDQCFSFRPPASPSTPFFPPRHGLSALLMQGSITTFYVLISFLFTNCMFCFDLNS